MPEPGYKAKLGYFIEALEERGENVDEYFPFTWKLLRKVKPEVPPAVFWPAGWTILSFALWITLWFYGLFLIFFFFGRGMNHFLVLLWIVGLGSVAGGFVAIDNLEKRKRFGWSGWADFPNRSTSNKAPSDRKLKLLKSALIAMGIAIFAVPHVHNLHEISQRPTPRERAEIKLREHAQTAMTWPDGYQGFSSNSHYTFHFQPESEEVTRVIDPEKNEFLILSSKKGFRIHPSPEYLTTVDELVVRVFGND